MTDNAELIARLNAAIPHYDYAPIIYALLSDSAIALRLNADALEAAEQTRKDAVRRGIVVEPAAETPAGQVPITEPVDPEMRQCGLATLAIAGTQLTPAEQIEGTQGQPGLARSGPPIVSPGRPAVFAGTLSTTEARKGVDLQGNHRGTQTAAAATSEVDELDCGLYGYSDYVRVVPHIFALARTLERQRDEALRDLALNKQMLARQCDLARDAEAKLGEAQKIIDIAHGSINITGTTVRGMKDSDPYKGPANYLADALDAYDAATARQRASE